VRDISKPSVVWSTKNRPTSTYGEFALSGSYMGEFLGSVIDLSGAMNNLRLDARYHLVQVGDRLFRGAEVFRKEGRDWVIESASGVDLGQAHVFGTNVYSVSYQRLSRLHLQEGVVHGIQWKGSELPPSGGFVARAKPIPVSASASSGLPVEIRVEGALELTSEGVVCNGVGFGSLIAYQSGGEGYLPAQSSRTFYCVEPGVDFLPEFSSEKIHYLPLISNTGGGLRIPSSKVRQLLVATDWRRRRREL
jgi:hypothetical protein